ncbi:MAG TPA: hypothetical protein VN969_47680 [Streptosporangiaceae bacterium]|nr:hypothetical protein [Streptosporangiaceae bacterium]
MSRNTGVVLISAGEGSDEGFGVGEQAGYGRAPQVGYGGFRAGELQGAHQVMPHGYLGPADVG